MANGWLKCRICGKEYKGCRTIKNPDCVFRWQDVACCPEHGAEYLEAVLVSRGELKKDSGAGAHEETPQHDQKQEVLQDGFNGEESNTAPVKKQKRKKSEEI